MLVKMGNRTKLIQLRKGAHGGPGQGVCVMEAVSTLYPGQSHTDSPRCVSNPLIGMAQGINDSLSDQNRQMLWKFVPKFIGTANDGLANERAKAGLYWLENNYPDILEQASSSSRDLPQICYLLRRVFNQARGQKKAKIAEEFLSVLMPHEPPSLAKLQWEKLQQVYGADVDPSMYDFEEFAAQGMAVAL